MLLYKVTANTRLEGIPHRFRGGKGSAEFYEPRTPEEAAILQASPVAERVTEQEAQPFQPPREPRRVTVGVRTTHDEGGSVPAAPVAAEPVPTDRATRAELDDMSWNALQGYKKGVYQRGMSRAALTEAILQAEA